MKRIFKLISVLTLLTTLPALAAEGHEGGGGAGICTANKCQTLTESGFRISQSAGRNELSFQTLDELDRVLGLLPSYVSLRYEASAVVGKENEVILVEVANQKKAKKFLQEYAAVLVRNGAGQLSKKIDLLGFSSNGVTYLVNDKFQGLSTRGQALLLIHEYSMRIKKVTLEDALRFDGALLDYLDSVENKKPVKMFPFLASMKNFNYVPNIESALLANVLNKAGSFDSLSAGQLTVTAGGAWVEIPYRTLLDLKPYEPTLTQSLSAGRYRVKQYSRLQFLQGFYVYLEKKSQIVNMMKMVEVTNEDFTNYLKTRRENFAIAAASTCGNREDNSFKFIPVTWDAPSLNVLGCNTIPTYSSIDGRLVLMIARDYYPGVDIQDYLVGMELQLPKKLSCTFRNSQTIADTSEMKCFFSH